MHLFAVKLYQRKEQKGIIAWMRINQIYGLYDEI